jgi:hypothetical protein
LSFGGGSENSPFEVDQYWIGVVFMVKLFWFLIKKKRYKYEDELGSNKILLPFPSNGVKKLLGISNISRKNPQAYKITIIAFTQKYLGYRIFHREQRYFF